MDYQNKDPEWLQQRLLKVYSIQTPENLVGNVAMISGELNRLDVQKLNNYKINFNDLNNTNNIAKILELDSITVRENQIYNLAKQYSETELNTAISNLPENTNPSEIIIEAIKQKILSSFNPKIKQEITMDDLPIMNYFETMTVSDINIYL